MLKRQRNKWENKVWNLLSDCQKEIWVDWGCKNINSCSGHTIHIQKKKTRIWCQITQSLFATNIEIKTEKKHTHTHAKWENRSKIFSVKKQQQQQQHTHISLFMYLRWPTHAVLFTEYSRDKMRTNNSIQWQQRQQKHDRPFRLCISAARNFFPSSSSPGAPHYCTFFSIVGRIAKLKKKLKSENVLASIKWMPSLHRMSHDRML